ncbi:hypothetical protein B5X24_HaOG208237 [Helicoverpa armigera]|uniref:Uncharacterized protein n=1 Tax=Helicoverpa armigera TaxID=29058 RepID=A0A2W1BKF1_HELAM|nr:hypothetical protein B5X24_HaOG208237 [Helicoverpa armigera]
MGAKLLLVLVIFQTIITALKGFTLPLSDTVGIVTPIQPKPLTSFTAEASPITKSPLIWDGEDIMSKLFSPAAPGWVVRQFSSPITFTSSSKALPVPKIDQSSLKDVKMPERLGKRLLPSDCSRNVTPYSLPPKVSLPYKSPLWSSPTKLPVSSTFTSSDIHSAIPNRLSSISSLQSLPPVPLEPFKRCDLSSFLRTNDVAVPPTSKAISTPDFLAPHSLPFNSANSLPYPLYYRSRHLPGVRTPESFPFCSERIYTETLNFNVQNPTDMYNPLNTVSDINKQLPLSLNSAKVPDTPKFTMFPTPKIPNTIPFSPGFPSGTKPGASVAPACFKPTLPELSNHIPFIAADKLSDTTSPFLSPKVIQEKPLFPFQSSKVQSTPVEFDVLRNCTKTIENLNFFSRNKPNSYPATDTWLNTREALRPNINRYYVENIINPYIIIPEVTPYSSPVTEDYVPNSFLFSPPTIPVESIPTTYYPAPSFSPISSTPTISTSIAQTMSYMAPNFSEMVSNFTEQLLCSCKSYLKSITQNVKASIYSAVNPYAYSGLEPQALPRVNPMPTNSALPKLYSPTYSSKSPAIDFSTFTSINSPVLEIASSDLSPVSSLPTSTVTKLSSFKDVSSPSLNPSYLPSPTLPSSSSYKDTPVKPKSKSSKRDSDDGLLETMLIAEILNDDDSFDWEDLDAFLALLSLS